MSTDYRQYHQLERYLIGVVGKNFRKTGVLSEEDFYLIISWKANRAITKTYTRLSNLSKNHVKMIAKGIKNATDDKERLRVLVEDWGFALPMATAVLAILYPTRFTIYDVRVRDALGMKPIHAKTIDRLWPKYVEFKNVVESKTPKNYSLRDKDRYLWGKSRFIQLKRDLKEWKKAGV